MQSIINFSNKPFSTALKEFFTELKVPVNYIAEEPAKPVDILGDKYNENREAHKLIEEVYAFGMVDDAIFAGKNSFHDIADIKNIQKDYDGILIFGVTLKNREADLLPTRSQLADISRAFNRAFPYTPVTVIFKYNRYLALANSERQKYSQEWREGEKIGKVQLLRDIDCLSLHAGHERILLGLTLPERSKDKVNSFKTLYQYWQEVFSVSILNKKFYQELSNWYFWAMGEVTFPGADIRVDKNGLFKEDDKFREHNAKNLIRLLTRILFVWFIKEKKLIPEQIFEENFLQTELLNDFHPQKETGLFAEEARKSKYYKAILQNLFFATLNQTKAKREFRKKDQHYNNTNLMRYESYFRQPNKFLEMVESVVPFMNGGLFECLDKPSGDKTKKGGDLIDRQDGFSDRDDNKLVVPDYIFFGTERDVNLSEVLNSTKKADKAITVKGLLNILKAYKFTVAENTPVEEEIALDPELLGKVFENLLASYNPETKTTARKQTGSFYTPREIVDYMVDESLKAYLKQKLETEAGIKAEDADTGLEILFAYTEKENVFNETETNILLRAIDECKILDPACGSGAFPMGILHKLVMVLHKLDPQNKLWKDRQIAKVDDLISQANSLDDDKIKDGVVVELEKTKVDIEEAFNNNELDYGRKLFLIESCIYGVDIQPIATQISKLRFFISLIVDQTVNCEKENFGVRPLPNLETKFVTANTLIGIDRPKKGEMVQVSLFDNPEIDKLEKKLKDVRHSLFRAKDPKTKRKYRQMDEEIREEIGDLLIENGWANDTARQLAAWDPYDQNGTSPFFDMEWMFGISEGFDVVIGNPPYVNVENLESNIKKHLFANYETCKGRTDIYIAFIERTMKLLKQNGSFSFIIPYPYTNQNYGSLSRKMLVDNYFVREILDTSKYSVFETAVVKNIILSVVKCKNEEITTIKIANSENDFFDNSFIVYNVSQNLFLELKDFRFETKDISLALNLNP